MTEGKLNSQVELNVTTIDSSLWNSDFHPVPIKKRNWTKLTMMFLWISMSINIPSYMLGSSLIGSGLNLWQSLLATFLGCIIVLIPMILVAHSGTKYGVPFPVIVRSIFGVNGAKAVAMLRAVVACGWFGIQSFVAGNALFAIISILLPLQKYDLGIDILGISLFRLSCFIVIVLIQMVIIKYGMKLVRELEVFAAPFLLLLGVAIIYWAYINAGGFISLIKASSLLSKTKYYSFWHVFLPGLTSVVGFWSTLALNIPDFSRFVRSQKDQIIGQSLGMPICMTFISLIGIVTTSATIIVFGKAIWDPIRLIGHLDRSYFMIVPLLGIILATICCNIGANLVSSSNDISNLYPKWISFKHGGYIACVIGIVILPWKLISDPNAYVFKWLLSYSALLGAIGGVMIADYFVVRKTKIKLLDLFKEHGTYRYSNGWHVKAFIAVICGIIPNIPGFLFRIGLCTNSTLLSKMDSFYNIAWFISSFVSFIVYCILSKIDILKNRN